MSELQAFLDAIAAAPNDVAVRNAFNDWLRDRGYEPPDGEIRKVSDLLGRVMVNVVATDDELTFHLADGNRYRLYHSQDCCESVRINDINGDLRDLIGHPLTLAEESVSNETPADVPKPVYQNSCTWTFYRFATVRGYVNVRWYGESNGYYSESVDFAKV